jgi:hypothetical protein
MDDLQGAIRDYVVKESLEEGDEREIRIPDAEATPAAFDSVTKIAELVTRIRSGAVTA